MRFIMLDHHSIVGQVGEKKSLFTLNLGLSADDLRTSK